jgi:putative Mg2+ transporter-C (MgtC) family protein
MASCGFLLLLPSGAGGDEQSRIIQGLITGIGFIGGGAILKERGGVRGTATAASIWNTGAIGAAVALELWYVAILISIMNYATFRMLRPIKRRLGRDTTEDSREL